MKITPSHLARGAFVYIRQSTTDQLLHNPESRRRQYGLADRARRLGWTAVEVIDDDLGRSGGGINRPGFERLLAAICAGRVGAVFAIEASRLARNGRDWHTLIEFCGLVGTVIVDEDGTYEPRYPNDRLLLGMKGTMSELELSLLRARSMEALKQKARRGELFFTVAVGYVKVGHDKIEMDPDLRVREAIGLVFTRFAEMQSIRQVFLSLRGDQIVLPYIDPKVSGQHQVLWKLPVYATVSNLLTNPVYAGAYAFGRTGSRVIIENGRKRIVRGRRKDRSDWAVLLVDHHEGYLSWADFERNQRLIADNANGKGMMVRGPVRKGEALLAGLLRCGHCGRRLLVSYNGTKGDVGRYNCDATRSNPGAAPCISSRRKPARPKTSAPQLVLVTVMFFQRKAICSISSNRRTLFRPGSDGRRYFYDLKVFTERARQRAATRPLSSRPFARHCALPNEFGLQRIATARVS